MKNNYTQYLGRAERPQTKEKEMNKLPFDLTKALAGETVVTRNGGKVDSLRFFDEVKMIAAVYEGKLCSWSMNGEYLLGKRSEFDLFMAAPKPNAKVTRYLWANKGGCIGMVMFSEEEARKHLSEQGYTIKLEWSATEFDE